MTVAVSSGRRVRRSISSASMPSAASFSAASSDQTDANRVRDQGDILARLDDARLADRQDEVVELGHRKRAPIGDFVLEKDHWVGIADRGLEQTLRVGGEIRRDHLQSRNVRIPRRIVLTVLRGDAGGRAVWSAEHDRATHLTAGHVARLCRGIDDLVDRLHGEIPGHEFDDGPQVRRTRRQRRGPAKPCSVIGVSMTRRAPNSSSRPWLTL